MRRSNFALRVPPTLFAEARKAAESVGVALNQLITLALAEKVSAMRTEEYFAREILLSKVMGRGVGVHRSAAEKWLRESPAGTTPLKNPEFVSWAKLPSQERFVHS
jgi:hypothetical protein